MPMKFPPRKINSLFIMFFALTLPIGCRRAEQATAVNVGEPPTYAAKITYSYLPGGNRGVQPNKLFTLDIARRGPERRYVFNLEDRQLQYVEGPQRNYLIAPACRQYADVTLEAMNFRIPSALSPEELIDDLKRRAGEMRLVGDEDYGGRSAARYVTKDDRPVYIDRASGLPLRAEVAAKISPAGAASNDRQASDSAERGALLVIMEMSEVRTEVEPRVFELPEGMSEVQPAAMCANVKQTAEAATRLLWAVSDKN